MLRTDNMTNSVENSHLPHERMESMIVFKKNPRKQMPWKPQHRPNKLLAVQRTAILDEFCLRFSWIHSGIDDSLVESNSLRETNRPHSCYTGWYDITLQEGKTLSMLSGVFCSKISRQSQPGRICLTCQAAQPQHSPRTVSKSSRICQN